MAKFSITFFIGITDDNLDIPGVEFTADPGVAETAENYEKDGVALLRLSPNRLVKSTALTEDRHRSDDTNETLFYIDAEFDVPDEALKQTLGVDAPEDIDPSNFMFVCGEFTKIAATPASALDE